MVVLVQNPTVMGYFEPAVKYYSDVVGDALKAACMQPWTHGAGQKHTTPASIGMIIICIHL